VVLSDLPPAIATKRTSASLLRDRGGAATADWAIEVERKAGEVV